MGLSHVTARVNSYLHTMFYNCSFKVFSGLNTLFGFFSFPCNHFPYFGPFVSWFEICHYTKKSALGFCQNDGANIQIYRQTNRETDSQRDTQTNTETDPQTDIQTSPYIYIYIYIYIEDLLYEVDSLCS